MPERPYRTNDDMKIIANRSKSADGRLHQAYKSQDPKLSSFHRGTHYILYNFVNSVKKSHFDLSIEDGSTTNLTEDVLNEVVNDKEHRSVRDLVAMMEQNTRSESINPYVRKWGCDLISHEPHRKNVTLRTEKRQIVDQNELNRSLERHHQQQQQ